MTDSSPFETLPPEGRAVLSLIVTQGRSYAEIAELLALDPADVRARALAAADRMLDDGQQHPPPGPRSRIVDYLLGQQSVSERERTRAGLAASQREREWAGRLSALLAPLSASPLPAIPEAATTPSPDVRSIRIRHPQRRVVLIVGGLASVAAGVAIALATDAGSPSRALVGRSQQTTSSVHTIRRLVLVPAGRAPQAFGAGAIVRQNGGLLLLLQARGLVPNSHDYYAVWLFNTPVDSRLLGAVTPAVGAAGTFSSGVPLPDDAVRYHELLVTIETNARPDRPGRTVLQSPLGLGT
jgi:hypothetical protein